MILLTGGDSMERMFNLDWQLIADASLMLVAVFVMFMFMSYLLFNPARKLLNNRRDKIRNELEEARSSMEKAQKLQEEYEGKLREADKEVEAILSEARKRGLANENQMIAQAKEDAAAILERARVEAQLEKQKIADEVKREMVSIASLMAGKIVSASIDTTVQSDLIEETLKEMGEGTWLS